MEPYQSIEEWRVREFEKNVYLKLQQVGGRLHANADQAVQHAKYKSYDLLGSTSVQEKTERYGDTPNIDMEHSRRSIVLKNYEWGKLIDDQDLLKIINDPTSSYTMQMSQAFMRKKDEIFIERALGSALEGEDADSAVALPTAQYRCATTAAGAFSGINVNTLLAIKEQLDADEVGVDGEERMISMDANGFRSLLSETQVTSADYNSVKALVSGQIDTFLGFKFVRTQLIPATTAQEKYDAVGTYNAGGAVTAAIGSKMAIVWVKSGMKIAMGKEVSVQITPRADKKNIPQIYAWMAMGGVRMEDKKVIRLVYKAV